MQITEAIALQIFRGIGSRGGGGEQIMIHNQFDLVIGEFIGGDAFFADGFHTFFGVLGIDLWGEGEINKNAYI